MGELNMWMQYATKVCARCKIEKDIDMFGKDEKAKDGYQSYCKSCQKEVYTKWREEHRPQSRKLALAHYHRHKEDGSLCKHAPYIHPNKAIEWFDKWFGKANTEE